MKRTFLFLGFCFSSLLAVGGKVSEKSYELGFCFADPITRTYDVGCHRIFERLGDTFFYGGTGLALIFLVLFLVPTAFSAWKKFAIWATPVVVLIFATYSGSGGFDMVSPDPETLFKWISIIYVIVSLLIIGSVALKNRTRG